MIDMVPSDSQNDQVNLAVMATELRHISKTLDQMGVQMTAYVTRNEFEQRSTFVDKRFADIETQQAARRVPWTSVAAIIIAGATLLMLLINNYGA